VKAADLDRDGDCDIVLLARDRGRIFLRNDLLKADAPAEGGAAKAHWVSVA